MAAGTSQDKRAQARELAQAGVSCRSIADRLGVSRTSVSRWAKEDGYSFDRSQTAAATSARQFDMAAARLRIAEKMTANADRALDALDGPYLVYSFGGRDNDYNEHELAEAPISARREAQTIAGIAFDKLTKALDQSDANADEAARSLMTAMARKFGIPRPGSTEDPHA